MSSAFDPDPMIRRQRPCPMPADRVRTGVGIAALCLALVPAAAAAAPRAVPALPGRPVVTVADRSSDPLANVPLRGRVTAPAVSGGQSMFRSSAEPAMQAPRGDTPAPSPAPLAPAAAAEPAQTRPPAARTAPLGLRDRTATPAEPVRSAIPYHAPGTPQMRQPVTAARPVSPAVEPAAIAPAMAGGVAPVTAAPAPAAAPPAAPVTAALQPDGSLLLTWTVSGKNVQDPFLVTVLGPDEQTAMRTVRTQGASWSYPPEAQQIDFGLPVTDRVCVRVRSASDGAGSVNVAPICIQVAPAS